jgi:hypothetical protein
VAGHRGHAATEIGQSEDRPAYELPEPATPATT